MKYIIAVLFALFGFASAVRFLDELPSASMECIKALKVPDEHVKKYEVFDFPDDKTTRCYIACVYEKLDFFNPKDGFKTEKIITELTQNAESKENVKAAIKKCVDKNDKGSDSCTWAYRVFTCYEQEIISGRV